MRGCLVGRTSGFNLSVKGIPFFLRILGIMLKRVLARLLAPFFSSDMAAHHTVHKKQVGGTVPCLRPSFEGLMIRMTFSVTEVTQYHMVSRCVTSVLFPNCRILAFHGIFELFVTECHIVSQCDTFHVCHTWDICHTCDKYNCHE
jgi:hypothetical protein